MRYLPALVLTLLLIPGLAVAVTLGQTDDFQDGLQGWLSGSSNPNPPVAVLDLGPGGAGDRAMQVTSNGSLGAGGKIVVFNQTTWTGDYLAAAVNAVALDVKNLSSTGLRLRLALDGPGGRFVTGGVDLPASSGFRRILFSLHSSSLTSVGGSDVDTTLQGVTELRLLHSLDPDHSGDPVVASIAVDNITAVALVFIDDFEDGSTTSWSSTVPSAGDECSLPLALSENVIASGVLSDNTGSLDDTSCGTLDRKDEWFLYTASCDGIATITTCLPGTVFDTVLAAFSSCGGTQLACNDDDELGSDPACVLNGANRKSKISIAVSAGTTILVRVSAFNDDISPDGYELTAFCGVGR